MITLYYNFQNNGRKFDKGGAIKYCQQIIGSDNYDGIVLILDSDIYLPDNFTQILNNIKIENNTLYGVEQRLDYHCLYNFQNNIVDDYYYKQYSPTFVGFFQLYKNRENLFYPESYNCSDCDMTFINNFDNKIVIPNLNVSHLGQSYVNWEGRDKSDFDLIGKTENKNPIKNTSIAVKPVVSMAGGFSIKTRR